jgi:RHS repeat-associated protein
MSVNPRISIDAINSVNVETTHFDGTRYYDPMIERFLGEDPIGFASGDYNFYRYVWNLPAQYIDPSGLDPFGDFAPFDPKYDLRFCVIAADADTDSDGCRDIVYECLMDGTLPKKCKTPGNLTMCQLGCTASDFYQNLKKFCKPRLKKPKMKGK